MLLRRSTEAEPDPAQGRIAGDGPVAVIDIGSNSVRLVVYERLARSPTPLFNEKMLAGLGAGVAETGRLAPDAVTKTKAALRRFAALAEQMGVTELEVLATAATREASNGADFIRDIEAICGVPVTVLSGADEARIAALGIVAGFQNPDGVAGDLGGGSLELTEVSGRQVGVGDSLLLGGLRLQTTSKGSVKAARDLARRALEGSKVVGRMEGRSFYAIGGTWRSLARLHMHECGYPLQVMHEYKIGAGQAEDFLKLLSRGSLESVPGIEVVSKQRQTLLPFGAVVLAEVLRAGKPKTLIISALGLREGLLYSKLSPEEQAEDPLLSAARELSLLRSRSPQHAEELIAWSDQAMQAVGLLESAEEKRLRAAACLLSDIGWRAHPDYRGEQSLNIISHAAFVGIDHPGRSYLALAVYYRHAGLTDEHLGPGIRELAPLKYREAARAVAGAFRVAYLVSGAVEGVLPRTRLRRSNDRVELVLPVELRDLAGPRLETRLKQFAALGGLTSRIVVDG
ncbi:MAG: exopolyphosphatase [Rhizobiales bacterium]|nr:exopolyphosphatase [Hyphomicrobiales bacterium]MDQ3558160.1 exopolyphosphatase [Pseudomonadota bacterium]